MNDENNVQFDLELGLLNKGIIPELKRIAFKYGIDCTVVSGGGFLSTIYSIRLKSKPDSVYSARKLYKATIEQLREMTS